MEARRAKIGHLWLSLVYDSRPRQGRSRSLYLILQAFKPKPVVSYDPHTHRYPLLQESALEPPFPPMEHPQSRPPIRLGEADRARIRTLSVTDRGGASLDIEEIREKLIASREQLKGLVHRPPGSATCISASANSEGCTRL